MADRTWVDIYIRTADSKANPEVIEKFIEEACPDEWDEIDEQSGNHSELTYFHFNEASFGNVKERSILLDAGIELDHRFGPGPDWAEGYECYRKQEDGSMKLYEHSVTDSFPLDTVKDRLDAALNYSISEQERISVLERLRRSIEEWEGTHIPPNL